MRSQDKRVPIAQLPMAIEHVLAGGPRTIGEIARALGYSVVAVRARLEQLEIDERAHRVRTPINAWAGYAYMWHLGAAAGAEVLPCAVHAQTRPTLAEHGVVPCQSTVRTYPAINRRDPLVAALFGPARQAAA